MSTNYRSIAGCMLNLFAVCVLSTHAAENATKEQSSISFKGKVVLLIIDRSSALEKKNDTEYISDAVVQKLGDRYFITGSAFSMKDDAAKEQHDWRRGSQIGVAWEKVQQYYVFSPERMEEIIKKRIEEQK